MIANCGREPRALKIGEAIGQEWISADLLLGNLPDASATLTSLDLAGWDARIYSAGARETDAVITG